MTATIAADYDPLTMSDTESAAASEEPTETQFSVMRRGEETALGPYTINEIFDLLKDDQLARNDYVYYEGMADWAPIEEVFEIQEQLSHFVDDGQDREKVAEIFQGVSPMLAAGEDIYYIAVQEKTGLLTKQKAALAVTNKRLFILHEKRSGLELETHRWDAITNTLMKDEGHGLATFSILLHREKRLDTPHLPMAQVKRMFQLAQELGDVASD
jgi:hypothetical protein